MLSSLYPDSKKVLSFHQQQKNEIFALFFGLWVTLFEFEVLGIWI